MKRFALACVLLLAPALASAQGFIRYTQPGGGGGAPTFPLLAPNGSAGAPSYSFTNDSDSGLFLVGAGDVALAINGSSAVQFLGFGVTHFTNTTLGDDLSIAPSGTTGTKFTGTIANGVDLTANRTWGFPDASGDVAVVAAVGFPARTAALTWAARQFTSPNGTLMVGNPAGTGGDVTLDYDTAIVQQKSVGTAAPTAAACDAAAEVGLLYHQSGDPAIVNGQLFRCTQTGPATYAWMPAGHQSGTTAPATCTVGNVFFDTDATAGSNWFGCTSANTWTLLGGGLADPGSNGMLSRTAANTTVARDITAGEGITIANGTGVSGNPTVTADRAVVPFKGSGTADPSASCGDTGDPFQLNDTYIETDTSEVYLCIAIDTWALIGHIADDKVIVGTGTTGVVETIPDCDDTGGNHLNYNTTGTAGSRFSCGTSSSGGAGAWTYAFTTSDASTSSDNTANDDAVLQFAVSANKTYAFDIFVVLSTSSVTPGVRWTYTCPSSPTFVGVRIDYLDNDGTSDGKDAVNACAGNLDTAGSVFEAFTIMTSGIFTNGANAGTFAFAWAQSVSDASATLRKAGSWIRYKQVD